MKQIRKRLTYANVMSSIAVFLILGGATAFAASKIGTNQLQAGAVTTAKIKRNAVTGAKVKEASLGKVPKAANADSVGGVKRSQLSVAASGYRAKICDPNSTAFAVCVSVDLNFPHKGQALLVGAGGQNSAGKGVAEGTCEFSVDGEEDDVPAVDPGESATDNTNVGAQNGFALTSVTATLPAGSHTFNLICNERVGDVEMHDTSLSVQLIG